MSVREQHCGTINIIRISLAHKEFIFLSYSLEYSSFFHKIEYRRLIDKDC